MTPGRIDIPTHLGTLSEDEWWQGLEALGQAYGVFHTLGEDHAALFLRQGRTLLVTFETVAAMRSGARAGLPTGYDLVAGRGFSHLALIARAETWFRDPVVLAFFERLRAAGFWAAFDRVAFFGAGMCGYAACAFSAAAPGATVLAIRPQATLDPAHADWDLRFPSAGRPDFRGRFGHAPDMVRAAAAVFLLYDPAEAEDARHVALFTQGPVTPVRCRFMEDRIEDYLRETHVLPDLLAAAAAGRLSEAALHRARRARRDHVGYLRRLVLRLDAADRPYLVSMLAASILTRIDRPMFRQRLERANERLRARGLTPPAERHAA
jgi:hypothetical protein